MVEFDCVNGEVIINQSTCVEIVHLDLASFKANKQEASITICFCQVYLFLVLVTFRIMLLLIIFIKLVHLISSSLQLIAPDAP